MKSVTFRAELIRKFPDPIFKAGRRHILMCDVCDLEGDIPKQPNPREQNINRRMWREIGDHLMNYDGADNTFHLMNKGITIIASHIQRVNDATYCVDFGEGDGILDGGHTYELILKLQDQIRAVNKETPGKISQFVKVEILTGINADLIPHIAGGLNTAIQVQKFALANLQKEFEWVKNELKAKGHQDHVAFMENEDKPYDVRDILCLLECFNAFGFPNDGPRHPIQAYVSKNSVLISYLATPKSYMALQPIFGDILKLRDIISSEVREYHNIINGGRAGGLCFVEGDGEREFDFHFINKVGTHRVSAGALYPMLAAFRWFVDIGKNGLAKWNGGFKQVLRIWDEIAPDLILATQACSDETGRRPYTIGRCKSHWSNLHNMVAKKHLMQSRKR